MFHRKDNCQSVNLSDQVVKINQQSVLGKLEEVDTVYSRDSHPKENFTDEKVLPKQLQILLQNVSTRLSEAEEKKLSNLLITASKRCHVTWW